MNWQITTYGRYCIQQKRPTRSYLCIGNDSDPENFSRPGDTQSTPEEDQQGKRKGEDAC